MAAANLRPTEDKETFIRAAIILQEGRDTAIRQSERTKVKELVELIGFIQGNAQCQIMDAITKFETSEGV